LVHGLPAGLKSSMTSALSSTALLSRLVGFDTVSSGSNLALVQWVADYLDVHGVEVHLTYDHARLKANLFATLGPRDEGGVCLHGHTDVVPVADQPWSTDPFRLTQHDDGRLYGRGTCDMKAWLACALAAVPQMARRPLLTPLHLALSYDEEVGCLGAPGMIDSFGRDVPKPQVAIVGEPSLMAPITAHKGLLALDTRITGRAAHSSLLHLGVSAVSAAAEMAVELHRLAGQWMTLPGPEGMEPSGPTLNVGVLQGGTARNVIAPEARLLWEIRFRAGDDVHQLLDDALARVRARLRRSFGARFDLLQLATQELATIPAFDAGPGGAAETLVRSLGAQGRPLAVPYGAEAGQYQAAGISTVICGPGSIEQAHQANEYIELAQVQACDALIDRLVHWAREVRLEA
jgi:acetylornithine deacetylase